jgi:hypothetical protein
MRRIGLTSVKAAPAAGVRAKRIDERFAELRPDHCAMLGRVGHVESRCPRGRMAARKGAVSCNIEYPAHSMRLRWERPNDPYIRRKQQVSHPHNPYVPLTTSTLASRSAIPAKRYARSTSGLKQAKTTRSTLVPARTSLSTVLTAIGVASSRGNP